MRIIKFFRAFGEVFKAVHRETHFAMAAKLIPIKSGLEEIQKEIEILRKCKSSYIVNYFGTCTTSTHLWVTFYNKIPITFYKILMDYCAGGSIRAVIETLDKTLTEEQVAYVCKCTLQGLVDLHGMNIIHRDVKAANILLTLDGKVKIADFGVSEQLDAKVKESIGTPLWMAPGMLVVD